MYSSYFQIDAETFFALYTHNSRKETAMKNPKKFSWKVTSKDKPLPGTIVCQEQCSSGGGGNGKCGADK